MKIQHDDVEAVHSLCVAPEESSDDVSTSCEARSYLDWPGKPWAIRLRRLELDVSSGGLEGGEVSVREEEGERETFHRARGDFGLMRRLLPWSSSSESLQGWGGCPETTIATRRWSGPSFPATQSGQRNDGELQPLTSGLSLLLCIPIGDFDRDSLLPCIRDLELLGKAPRSHGNSLGG